MPPLADLFALVGIDMVVCAGCLRLLGRGAKPSRRALWITLALFVVLWIPAGKAQLPLLAYVRGVSSDLSITLVVLACLSIAVKWRGNPAAFSQEKQALRGVLAATSIVFYPLALGLGDWDPYRLGWGSWRMLLGLLSISALFWAKGLRLLPMLVAAALLCWCLDAMPSRNLWDYLLDPWLAVAALWGVFTAGLSMLRARWFNRTGKPIHVKPPGLG